MNIETVRPIPQSIQTDANAFQSLPSGSCTNFNFIAIQQKVNTPMNFPNANPVITENPTPPKRSAMFMEEKSIPTFEKANKGITM